MAGNDYENTNNSSELDYDSESQELEQEDYSYNSSSTPNAEPGMAVMSQFFDLSRQLALFNLKWKGLTIINGKPVRTHDPIACDRFVDELTTSIESIVSQHSSISTVKTDEGDLILWEKFDSFSRACAAEPTFQRSSYNLVKDEYDHMLQLFMGHVKNAHGIKSAQALQGGVVYEYDKVNKPQPSMLEMGKTILLGGNKQ